MIAALFGPLDPFSRFVRPKSTNWPVVFDILTVPVPSAACEERHVDPRSTLASFPQSMTSRRKWNCLSDMYFEETRHPNSSILDVSCQIEVSDLSLMSPSVALPKLSQNELRSSVAYLSSNQHKITFWTHSVPRRDLLGCMLGMSFRTTFIHPIISLWLPIQTKPRYFRSTLRAMGSVCWDCTNL